MLVMVPPHRRVMQAQGAERTLGGNDIKSTWHVIYYFSVLLIETTEKSTASVVHQSVRMTLLQQHAFCIAGNADAKVLSQFHRKPPTRHLLCCATHVIS
jgi:hypothetical protein